VVDMVPGRRGGGEPDVLVVLLPAGPHLTVILDSENDPEEVDENEEDGQTNKAYCLGPLLLQVERCPCGAEVARDDSEGGQQDETGHVTEKIPLVVLPRRLAQPLPEWPGPPLDGERVSADLAGVVVGRGQPFLDTAPVDQPDSPSTLTRRDQPLETISVMAYSAEVCGRVG